MNNRLLLILPLFGLLLGAVVASADFNVSEVERRNDAAQFDKEQDAANWDLSVLDTARNERYLSPIEKAIILEINKVRSEPRKYAELYLGPLLKGYRGEEYVQGSVITITNEGRAAVDECIDELTRTAPVKILSPDERLYKMALYHRERQGAAREMGHVSPDGKSMKDRSALLPESYSSIGENISYGSETARDVVLQLLIDDGVPSRGHRKNIMNQGYERIGVSFGPHKVWGNMAVMDLMKR